MDFLIGIEFWIGTTIVALIGWYIHKRMDQREEDRIMEELKREGWFDD